MMVNQATAAVVVTVNRFFITTLDHLDENFNGYYREVDHRKEVATIRGSISN